jgi:hypothetical protein
MGEAGSFVQALQGPLGGLLAVIAVGMAVLSGRLILPRELVAMERRAVKAEERGDRWEGLALSQMGLTARVVDVARVAAETTRTP